MRRNLLYSIVTLLIILIMVELCARAFYYRKPASSTLASAELLRSVKRLIVKPTKNRPNNSNHYLIRPQVSKEINDSIAAETARTNYSIYQPWSEFRFGDVNGKYVNVNNQVRKSVPDTGRSLVWFLGGSTMFGFNVTDEETIPSAFARMSGMKVVNYGTPYYYSYHELMFLTDKLYRGERPEVVIMLDGLNDCYAPYASINRHPFNTPMMQELMNPELYEYPSRFSYYQFPDSTKIKEGCDEIFKKYLENIAVIKKLSTAYGFKLYCFWQPVPFYNYPNRSADPICAKRDLIQFELIYPKVKETRLDYLFYLGDKLQDAKLAFIDSTHYSPSMNGAIARKMWSAMQQ